MISLVIRVAIRSLALLILSASFACAEVPKQPAAARDTAALVIPKLEAGDWQACKDAFKADRHLARSKDAADGQLADKLLAVCATAIERGLKNLPTSPVERNDLLRYADSLATKLFDKPTTANIQRITSITDAWEKALPEDPHARVRRLGLHIVAKDREAQIKLAGELMNEEGLPPNTRDWARGVHLNALLRGKLLEADIARAETVVNAWLAEQPENVTPRRGQLQIFRSRQHWLAEYELATELLDNASLDESWRDWVRDRRIEGALKAGKMNELTHDDWMFMLDRIGLGHDSRIRRLIDEHSELLIGLALAAGWIWLLSVAFITRCLRAKPPGFWMVSLWTTVILYASAVIMVPPWQCIIFSLLGIGLLIYASTGTREPVGYLVTPQMPIGSGRVRWPVILGWCVVLFLLIQSFNVGYAWAFERIMGRKLESQLVVMLLQKDTILGLIGVVIAGGIFVPFLEEVVFRGILQDWLGRLLPVVGCVALVSVIFGLVHGLEMAIPIMFIGMLLSLLRIRYRSLWPAITLHALNNSVLIIALYLDPASAHL